MITLKSLLKPSALEHLNPEAIHFYCSDATCSVVYFDGEAVFGTDVLKVPVFHKDDGADVPVCYCFHWTRTRIADEVRATGASTAAEQITEHIRAGRCGCEVNNPQGSCCLGNVRSVVKKTLIV